MTQHRDEPRRPTVGDVDPQVLGVDSLDDQTRMHADDETGLVQVSGGGLMAVDDAGRPVVPGDPDQGADDATEPTDSGAAGAAGTPRADDAEGRA